MMHRFMLMALLVGSGLLAGCASVPMTSPALDLTAEIFTPESGKASIYVTRSGFTGAALIIQVVLDGRIAGSLAPGTFQLLSVPPGKHIIATIATENIDQHELVAEAGKNYFYRTSLSMGFATGHVHIDPISEEVGHKEVMSSKRAEATTYQ